LQRSTTERHYIGRGTTASPVSEKWGSMRQNLVRFDTVAVRLFCSFCLILIAAIAAKPAAPPPLLPPVPAVVATFASVGIGPWGVAFDSIHSTMWVATANANSLTEYSLISPYSIVRNVSVPNPFGVAFDSIRGNLWVADASGNRITVVDSSTGVVLAIKPTGGVSPAGVCYDGVNMWVENSSSNNVTKFNGATFAAMGTFAVLANPQACAVDTVTGEVWVTDQGANQVTVLNLSGALVTNLPVGMQPSGIAFDGTNMWVANQKSNSVWKIVGSTFATAAIVAVPAGPRGVIYGVGAATPYVWVVNTPSGRLTQIKAASAAVTGVAAAFGVTSQWGAFDPVNNNIWVANTSSNSITVLH
jgi:DNA-binding beta-propeller fold protein YncE